ncbi:MAG: hypothetical protein IJP11_06280 [Oscillospiraceae bacterium]|nr:hypothetical protein [Oscillospiraceae bacterium]
MEQKMMEGRCPKCGKPLQIPEGLKEFSCLYCGARLDPTMLLPLQAIDLPEELIALVNERMPACVEDAAQLRLNITKADYAKTFEAYCNTHRPTFQRLEEACVKAADRREDVLQSVIDAFLAFLEDKWKGQKKDAPETDKMAVAIYMVPAVRYMKLGCSEDFCKMLQAEWMRRYPKNPFYVGSYEELSAGFNKKFLGFCFITTAVCRQEGKPDDCEELTAFRAFRDGWLRQCPDGEALIREYYETAPAIVTMISVCENGDTAYGEIRERWLEGCYRDLQQGRMEECKARYTDMVRTLQNKYLH